MRISDWSSDVCSSDLITRADSLEWTVDAENGNDHGATTLQEFLRDQELLIGYPDEMAGRIADRMAVSGVGRIPIVDRATGQLLGLIARKDLLRVQIGRGSCGERGCQ